MKQANKLILAVTCYALSFVLLLGGSLYLLADPSLQGQQTVTPQDPENQPTVNAQTQNKMMITEQAFKDPENKYRALKIDHDYALLAGETAQDKVETFSELGFGGMATNAVWDAAYLQSKYTLAQFNDFVQAMHDAGYRIWLYDEKGYPSGSAGDLTVKDHPEYAAVRLVELEFTGSGKSEKTSALPDGFVQLEYALMQTGDTYTPFEPKIEGNKVTVTGVDGDWHAYVYCVARYSYHFEWNSSYPNILNRDAVARFIEVTFDTYEGSIENFSEVIESVFDDEAQLLAGHHIVPDGLKDPVIPYDYDIFETFQAKYGYDARPLLPLIYSGESAEAQRVRAQFYAHVGDLVSENFFGQIQEWCKAHSTQLSGHLLLEEQMFYHVPVYGDYIKCSLNMGYPGFDILNVRPDPYLDEMSTGGKYASSPAWLQGKERVFIEICPVHTPDEFATNHLDYALGTMTMAYFDGGNQVASYYGQANTDPATGQAFNTYVGRLGSMTVGAQNLTQVAIYYSIDAAAASYQAPETQNLYHADKSAKENDQLVGKLAKGLRKQGLDYVFLDDDSMQGGTVTADGLQVGKFTFTTIIVPAATVMDIESMRVLDALIENDVNVIFVEEMPSIAFMEKDQAELEALCSKHASLLCKTSTKALMAVTTTVDLQVNSDINPIYVSPYEKDGVKFFFLANATGLDADITLSYPNATGYRIYDPVSGKIFEVESTANIKSYRALFVQPLLPEQ